MWKEGKKKDKRSRRLWREEERITTMECEKGMSGMIKYLCLTYHIIVVGKLIFG